MSDQWRAVRIVGLPTDLFVRSQEHLDELLHELELLQVAAEAGVTAPPRRLRELMEEILGDYVEARHRAWEQGEAARRSGQERFDLDVLLPPEAADAGERLLSLLEQADELCRDQHLMTLAAPPEVVALRRWMAQEMTVQLKGDGRPTPCPL